MTSEPNLLPRPRRVQLRPGRCRGNVQPTVDINATLARPQMYRLLIAADRIEIAAADPAAAFYARQTLVQLRRQFHDALPCLEIEDWPDFTVRGVMLDISRDKVPTMATLFALIDQLAELKINQLQLYTEHTFAYSQHREVWEHASPMTAQQIRELDVFCRERFIELVPNQNSFGHMERWLRHKRYEPLAEKPDGFTFPWGAKHQGGFTLNPLDPRSLELIEGLYDELLPNFTSRMINVGCDETFDLGVGKSKAEVAKRGKERVYLDFLLKIDDAVRRRGRTMQFWGDIILHKPELIPELPKDVVALNWGYDADHPFEKETQAFAAAGVPFYVCPGTSSWLSISGRTDNAIANLRNAAACGLAAGAAGYLITDWGDLGHLQYLPISYLGLTCGAACAWCLDTNRDISLSAAMDLHIFRDGAGVMGQLVHDFGNVYQAIRTPMGMSTRLFWTLVGGPDRKKLYEMVTIEEYDEAERRIAAAVAALERAQMDRLDAELIKSELRNAAAMLAHACRRGRWLRDPTREDRAALIADIERIIAEHRRLWLARNREGGLRDSVGRLEARREEYGRA